AVRVPSASPGSMVAAPAPRGSRSRPSLTVVVPVYNGGEDIVENVDVIRRVVAGGLPGEEVELIVVSDGSIDGTAERLLESRSDRDIRVIHYDRNLGKGYAVKAGALAAHGDWVALVHGRIKELPIRLEYRFSGSALRSSAVVRALWDTAAIFYRLRILRTYQRKRGLVGAAARSEWQPLVSVIGDHPAAEALDYPR